MKATWKGINSIISCKKIRTNSPMSLKIHDKTTSDAQIMSENFNDFWKYCTENKR